MRILHIMAGRKHGGAETYSTDVMLHLHAVGIDQCVIMPRTAPRYAELEKAGIRMAPEVLDIPIGFVQRILLRRLIAREKSQIIHCWMRRAASLLPRATITAHTIGWFGGYYDPKHFGGCTDFVGVTKDIAAHMVKNGIPAEHAHFIPTFPNIETTPALDRATVRTPEDAKVFLTLSRLHPKKGLDTFLMALQKIPNAYAWLAGDGPLQATLEQQAHDLGITDRVRFLGWRTDRSALLRAADICVLPSRYEPFGTVILEAWAAKTPLIACRSAGPAAHIDDGVNGLLVPIDGVATLAAAMQRLISDSGLCESLVTQGYETYTQNYTPDSVTRQWIALYQKCVSQR